MADNYDNTNRGAAFAPFPSQSLILQGKLNKEGTDQRIALVKDQTADGKTVIAVYQRVGTLFENDKKGNEAAPDYTGPIDDNFRLAAWRKMNDNKPYMTFNVSRKSEGSGSTHPAGGRDLEDKIPF